MENVHKRVLSWRFLFLLCEVKNGSEAFAPIFDLFQSMGQHLSLNFYDPEGYAYIRKETKFLTIIKTPDKTVSNAQVSQTFNIVGSFIF